MDATSSNKMSGFTGAKNFATSTVREYAMAAVALIVILVIIIIYLLWSKKEGWITNNLMYDQRSKYSNFDYAGNNPLPYGGNGSAGQPMGSGIGEQISSALSTQSIVPQGSCAGGGLNLGSCGALVNTANEEVAFAEDAVRQNLQLADWAEAHYGDNYMENMVSGLHHAKIMASESNQPINAITPTEMASMRNKKLRRTMMAPLQANGVTNIPDPQLAKRDLTMVNSTDQALIGSPGIH